MSVAQQIVDVLDRFDRHTGKCRVCTAETLLMVESGRTGKEYSLAFMLSEDVKPVLCPEGRNLLLDIFNCV